MFLQDLLHCFSANAIELHTLEDQFVTTLSKYPYVSSLVRFQSKRDQWVVTQKHKNFQINPFMQQILPLLDGKKTCGEIVDLIKEKVKQGTIEFEEDGRA